MIKSYFKTAWRNLIRNKRYTIINILGLSIGLTACISLFVIISYELSFDRFHRDGERIYRVLAEVTESTGDKNMFCRVPALVASGIRNEILGTEKTVGFIPYQASIKINNREFDGKTTIITQPEYFEIFQFKWLSGNSGTALNAPNTVVITESKARQYFGNISFNRMIGKQIIYNDSVNVNVTGIIRDWKNNSDLIFTDFISFATLNSGFLKNHFNTNSWNQRDMAAWVFTKLKKRIDAQHINGQLNALVQKNIGQDSKMRLQLEHIKNMHFNEKIIENPIRTAHLPTLYTLLGVAILILIIAVFNFINLSTAQSLQRVKEVGIRKIMGGSRRSIVFQLTLSSFILTAFSVFLGILFVNPILQTFNSYTPPGIAFTLLDTRTIIVLTLITLLTSLFAGLYPANVLSSFLPIKNLKKGDSQKGGKIGNIQKGLIVFQFTISLIFIIGAIVIATQMNYIRNKDLGFKADAVIVLNMPRGESITKMNFLLQKLSMQADVKKLAKQWQAPMHDNPRGMKLKVKANDISDFWVTQLVGDENYIPLYDIKLLAGRNLSKSDSVSEFVINESLAKMMGFKTPEEALGKSLFWNDKPYPVIGVVADLHTYSLHKKVEPLCIINRLDRMGSLAVKLSTSGKSAVSFSKSLSTVERDWREVFPSASFSYQIFDESLAKLYEKDRQAANLMNIAMTLAIFISCIGLFGLVSHATQLRIKEIGIRKVIGASVFSILTLLSKEFIKLIIIAIIIAGPVAYYFMDIWLQDFVYRISIGWWIFPLSGIAVIIIAFITISIQTVKAAMANPIKSLRTE